MQEPVLEIDIPKRALFKAAEVCDLAKVQPYVLRSWESEFPSLGVAKSAGKGLSDTGTSSPTRLRHSVATPPQPRL